MTMTDDDIIAFIENFKFGAGPVAVERRNRGFTVSIRRSTQAAGFSAIS